MSAVNEVSVQEVVHFFEMYLEAEIDELKRQLCNVRKINLELLSDQLCSEVKLSSEEERKEIIKKLRDFAKGSI